MKHAPGVAFYLCLVVVAGTLGSALPFLIREFMEDNMVLWFASLQPWQQMALCVPALCLLFCVYYVLFAIAQAWKEESQAEQDRRAFVTRFRGEIDERD